MKELIVRAAGECFTAAARVRYTYGKAQREGRDKWDS